MAHAVVQVVAQVVVLVVLDVEELRLQVRRAAVAHAVADAEQPRYPRPRSPEMAVPRIQPTITLRHSLLAEDAEARRPRRPRRPLRHPPVP